MSQPGRIVYRCRRCGGLDRMVHTPDLFASVLALAANSRDPSAGFPCKATSTHACTDGGFGISDAIGGEPCSCCTKKA